MNKEFHKVEFPPLDGEEVVVGVHSSGIILEEGQRTGRNFYCSSCKRNVHCYVEVKDKKAEIIMTCSNDVCRCKCKTHYACKQCGYLHPYGKKCDRSEKERKSNAKSEASFEELMNKWKEYSEKDEKVLKKK